MFLIYILYVIILSMSIRVWSSWQRIPIYCIDDPMSNSMNEVIIDESLVKGNYLGDLPLNQT